MSIEVRNISKTFGNYTALNNISLKIENGELISLLGPSGSGKTTLLRIIAGMEAPDQQEGSQVLFEDKDVASKSVGERCVGFVFQHYALFKHMSVYENIAFGLRVRPHDILMDKSPIGESSLKAVVARINRAGAHVKVSLKLESQEEIRVDVSMERLLELNLQLADSVFVHPTKAKVFVPDYSI